MVQNMASWNCSPQEEPVINYKPGTTVLVILLLTATAKSLQSCPTLCDPIDGSPPGFPVPGILQARTLEWVAMSFSNAWKWKVKVKPLSRVRPSATPWTAAYQAPSSVGFSRQEYWSGVPLPSPVILQQCKCQTFVLFSVSRGQLEHVLHAVHTGLILITTVTDYRKRSDSKQ